MTAKSSSEISDIIREANYSTDCCGIITWCHTFSPGKMWINGLSALQKPYCHFATQYNREIPKTGLECLITAGGAHHSVLTYDVTAEQQRDFARIMDIEFVHISADTTPEKLEEELLVKDLLWKLK